MDGDQVLPQPVAEEAAGGTRAMFLALYFLVLAFFILLVSISSRAQVKSQAVMDSLSSTFATVVPPTAELTAFTAKEGEALTPLEFHNRISGMFIHALQIARVEVIQPGRVLRVEVPADALFMPGTATIREGQYPLLDRMIVAVGAYPTGLRYELEFVIGSASVAGDGLPSGRTLEMARGGAFVREMLARGAPPDALAIGLRPGNPAEIAIWFHTRAAAAGRSGFGPDSGARKS